MLSANRNRITRAAMKFVVAALALSGVYTAADAAKPHAPEVRERSTFDAEQFASTAPPRGAWRLSNTHPSRMRFAASHILIAHAGAQTYAHFFTARPNARTVKDAADLALRLSSQTQQDATSFERLAKEHSDDITTGPRGGALGALRGDQVPETFLDLLGPLQPGTVAPSVLRTKWGFHIVKREDLSQLTAKLPENTATSPASNTPLEEPFVEIPNPPISSAQDYVSLMDGDRLAQFAEEAKPFILGEINLKDQERAVLGSMIDELASSWRADGKSTDREKNLQHFAHFHARVASALGSPRGSYVDEAITTWIMRKRRRE